MYAANLNLNQTESSARPARVFACLTLPLFRRKRRALLKKLYQQTHSGLDLTNKLSQINQPVLLIYGDSDPITPKEYGEAATELLPSARLVILPQASHLAHLDQKDKFVRVVRNFVEATAD